MVNKDIFSLARQLLYSDSKAHWEIRFQCNVTAQWKWQQHCYCAQPSTALHWIQTVNWILILNDISISSLGFQAKTENAGSHYTCAKASGKKTGVSKWGMLYFTYITSYLTIPSRRGETPNNHFIKKCYTNKHNLTGEGSSWLLPWYSTQMEKLQW